MDVALFNLMNLNRPDETPAGVLAATRDLTVLAEEVGFDAAWFAEHHFSSQSVCCSPLMMAAHCAAMTRRIRLGPAVLVLPFYEPLRVLQELGMLDSMSEGRTILAFGAGHQPHEFRSFGLDMARRSAAMIEAWDIIEQGLTTGRVAFEGQVFKIPPTEIVIRPLAPRMPDLFVATGDPVMLRRAAERGATPFIAQGHKTLEAALPMRATVEAAFRAAGCAGPLPLAVQRYVFTTEDRNEARIAAQGMLDLIRRTAALRGEEPARDGHMLRAVPAPGEPSVDWLLENALIGDPELCADRLSAECEALGTTHLSLYMGFAPLPPARTARALELFAERVLPRLKRPTGSAQETQVRNVGMPLVSA